MTDEFCGAESFLRS